MQEFLPFLLDWLNKPITNGHVLGWSIGAVLAYKPCKALNEWLTERRELAIASKALEQRLAEKNENKVEKATYNPKPFRGWSRKEPYDPDKHFRRDGKTDRKW